MPRSKTIAEMARDMQGQSSRSPNKHRKGKRVQRDDSDDEVHMESSQHEFEVEETEDEYIAESSNVSASNLAEGLREVQKAVTTLAGIMIDKEEKETQAATSAFQQSHEDRDRLLSFMKLDPPKFTGVDLEEDPQRYLDEIWKRCVTVKCTDHNSVDLAIFRMEGDIATSWLDSKKREKPVETPPWSWDEFSAMFLERFLPESVRDARAAEFESLVQGDMTISEYDIQFTQLSKYARYLIPNEERKMKRFIRGLNDSLFHVIAAHEFKTYSAVVDRARTLESHERDVEVSYESQKRLKNDIRQTPQRSLSIGSFTGRGTQGRQVPFNQPSRFQHRFSSGGTNSQASSGGQSQSQRTVQSRPQSLVQPYSSPTCQFCGLNHAGFTCHRQTGACFNCGQMGHIARNCPRGNFSSRRTFNHDRGRGIGGRGFGGRGQAQPR